VERSAVICDARLEDVVPELLLHHVPLRRLSGFVFGLALAAPMIHVHSQALEPSNLLEPVYKAANTEALVAMLIDRCHGQPMKRHARSECLSLHSDVDVGNVQLNVAKNGVDEVTKHATTTARCLFLLLSSPASSASVDG